MPVDWMHATDDEVILKRKKEILLAKIIKYITGMTHMDADNYQKRIDRGEDGRRFGFVKVGHYVIGIGEGYMDIVIADEHDEDAIYDIDKGTACGLLNLIKQQKAMILIGGMVYGEEAE